jgi:hypothetical protein
MPAEITTQVSQTEVQPTNEVVKTEVAPVVEDKFKENFERIAKQEKFQAEQRKRLEAERLSLDQERAELAEYKKIKALKSEDPLKVLETLGLSLDEVVKAANSPRNIDPVAKKALEAVEKLQAELAEERDKAHKQKLTKVEQELTANIQAEIKAGEYDLIEQLQLSHTVREYMEEIYNKTGEITDIKDACAYVNTYLADNIKKVLNSKWLKEAEKKIEEVKEVEPVVKTTLTNKMTSEAPKTKKLMTDAERMQEAIKALSQSR